MAGGFWLIIDGSKGGLAVAADYYNDFPREPSPAGAMKLSDKTTTMLSTASVEAVLDEMPKAGASGVVMLVCHGTQGGMLLKLAGEDSAFAQGDALDLVEQVANAEAQAQQIGAMPAKTPAEQTAKADRWRKLFDVIGPGSVTGSFSLGEADAFYTRWVEQSAQRLKLPGKPQREALRRLIRKMKRVRDLVLSRVELRACNIGSDEITMKAVRRFFGCVQLLAPSAETFYMSRLGVFTMNALALQFTRNQASQGARRPGPQGAARLDAAAVLQALRTHNTRVFEGAAKAVIFSLTVDEVQRFHYRGYAAAPSQGAGPTPNWTNVRTFVDRFIMPGSAYSSGSLPVAGFWTPGSTPFLMPNEQEYLDSIKQVP